MQKLIGVVSILVLAVLLGQAALAGQGGGQGRGEGERHRPNIVFGTLQSVSGSSWTIKPELPPHMQERAQAKGRELPQLPDKVVVTVSEQTKFWLDGKSASAASFSSGDKVVLKLRKGETGNPVAVAVADPETAREYILEKMKEHRAGQGGGQGMRGKGQGRRGEGHPRLIFGTVSAVNGSSITVKPEMPEFLKDALPNKGEKLEQMADKLPASITVALDSETRFVVSKQEQSSNPFSSGDKVAILPMGEPGNATARIVSDYESAQAKMQERREKRQEKRAKNKGNG